MDILQSQKSDGQSLMDVLQDLGGPIFEGAEEIDSQAHIADAISALQDEEEDPEVDEDKEQFHRDLAESGGLDEYPSAALQAAWLGIQVPEVIQREPTVPDSVYSSIDGSIAPVESESDVGRGDEISIEHRRLSRILRNFTKDELKAIFTMALSVHYNSNNQKADLLIDYFKEKGFTPLGTGTNRIAFKQGEYVYKLALDRRGIIDNFMEFIRAPQAPQFLAHAYECCGVVLVAEYVDLIDENTFDAEKQTILAVLTELSKEFIMGDMGYTRKNYCNIGVRRKEDGSEALVFLDYAYMHTRIGNEKAFSCPACRVQLRYSPDFTQYVCPKCGNAFDYRDILWKLNSNYDNAENAFSARIADLDLEDLYIPF